MVYCRLAPHSYTPHIEQKAPILGNLDYQATTILIACGQDPNDRDIKMRKGA